MAGISPTFGSASRTENLCPHRAHLAGSALPGTVEERHFFDAICPRLTVKYILFCGLSFSVPPVFCIFRPSSKVVQRTYCPWQKSLSRLTPLRADGVRCYRPRNAVPRSPRFFFARRKRRVACDFTVCRDRGPITCLLSVRHGPRQPIGSGLAGNSKTGLSTAPRLAARREASSR